MVLVCCISKSHRLKVDFQDENCKYLLILNQNSYILDIWYVASPRRPIPSLLKLGP